MPNQGDGAVVLMRRGYVKAVERCHELQRHVALLADQDGRHAHLGLQPKSPMVAASATYGCSLRHVRLQPPPRTVAGCARSSSRRWSGLLARGGPTSISRRRSPGARALRDPEP